MIMVGGGRGGRARLLERCVSAICTHYQQLYLPYHQPRCNGASSTFHIIIPPRPASPRKGVWLETRGDRRWGQTDREKEGVIKEHRHSRGGGTPQEKEVKMSASKSPTSKSTFLLLQPASRSPDRRTSVSPWTRGSRLGGQASKRPSDEAAVGPSSPNRC